MTPSKSRYSIGVVLHVHREVAHRRIEGQALRDRPAHEDTLDLEPEVVVEPAGAVALHDEPRPAGRRRERVVPTRRLGRAIEVTLVPVPTQAATGPARSSTAPSPHSYPRSRARNARAPVRVRPPLGHDAPMRIGINGSSLIALGRPTAELAAQAAAAEADGFSSYWAAQLAVPDALTALAVVAGATSTIELGTAVIPIWLRHPLMLAAQALTLSEIAGDRVLLGIGLAHKSSIEESLGIPFDGPRRRWRSTWRSCCRRCATAPSTSPGPSTPATSRRSPAGRRRPHRA